MKKLTLSIFLLALTASFTLFTGCAKKQVKKTAAEEAPIEDADNQNVDREDLDIRGKEFVEIKDLEPIYFEFDSSQLSETARQSLASNYNFLKGKKNIEVLIEGHCDERGTVGYNLALGQNRAAMVRKYYIGLGMNAKIVGTVSYGKEKTICSDVSEECWSQNRRAITKVRSTLQAPQTPAK